MHICVYIHNRAVRLENVVVSVLLGLGSLTVSQLSVCVLSSTLPGPLELVTFLLGVWKHSQASIPSLSSSFETCVFVVIAGVLLWCLFLYVTLSEVVDLGILAGLSLQTHEIEIYSYPWNKLFCFYFLFTLCMAIPKGCLHFIH